MTKSKYIKITNVEAGGSYIQPTAEIFNAIDGELDGLEEGIPGDRAITLRFEAVEMTDEEYAALPEFAGY
jgi:hypothetical protein